MPAYGGAVPGILPPHAPLGERQAAEIVDIAANPEISCDKQDRDAKIRQCLSQLSVGQREVVDLIYYHGMSIGEVSRIIGVPTSTVKTRMFYARRRMERLLEASGIGLH